MFRTQIRTKNHSSKDLRGNIQLPFRSIVRLGSTTTTQEAFPKAVRLGKRIIECNTPEAIENSRSKLRMKNCFAQANVPQSDWWTISNGRFINGRTNEETRREDLPYPILIKRINGFKGHGMYKIDSLEQLNAHNHSLSGSYTESYHNYNREYRIHCTQERAFMSWRKLRRSDTPEDRRWFFNSENCNWVNEEHSLFDKPTNWDAIVNSCIEAMKSTGLDLGSFDVRVQSSRVQDPQFVLIEVNSAPSLGNQGIAAYKMEISRVLYSKFYNK